MDTRKQPSGTLTLPFARLTADQMRKMRVQRALDNPVGRHHAHARSYVPTQSDFDTAHRTPLTWTTCSSQLLLRVAQALGSVLLTVRADRQPMAIIAESSTMSSAVMMAHNSIR